MAARGRTCKRACKCSVRHRPEQSLWQTWLLCHRCKRWRRYGRGAWFRSRAFPVPPRHRHQLPEQQQQQQQPSRRAPCCGHRIERCWVLCCRGQSPGGAHVPCLSSWPGGDRGWGCHAGGAAMGAAGGREEPRQQQYRRCCSRGPEPGSFRQAGLSPGDRCSAMGFEPSRKKGGHGWQSYLDAWCHVPNFMQPAVSRTKGLP